MDLLSRSNIAVDQQTTQVHRVRRQRDNRLERISIIVICLLPCMILYFVFVLLPVIQAAYYSFFQWNGLDPLDNFIGIGNYTRIIGDRIFHKALTNNLIITILSIIIQLPLSLGLALLAARNLPGRTFFRMVFFLPYVLSDIVTGVIWTFIYRPDAGFLNTFLQAIIPGFEGQSWMSDPNAVLYAIFGVMIWKYFGLHLVLYVAALQDIPREIIEAARTDGSSPWQVIRYITIPLLGSTIRLTIFLAVLGSLQYFDLIFIMSDGGPVNASETMATYLVKFGFNRFALGYGSAVGVVMFLLCFGFAIAYQRYVMRRDLEGSVSSAY